MRYDESQPQTSGPFQSHRYIFASVGIKPLKVLVKLSPAAATLTVFTLSSFSVGATRVSCFSVFYLVSLSPCRCSVMQSLPTASGRVPVSTKQEVAKSRENRKDRRTSAHADRALAVTETRDVLPFLILIYPFKIPVSTHRWHIEQHRSSSVFNVGKLTQKTAGTR